MASRHQVPAAAPGPAHDPSDEHPGAPVDATARVADTDGTTPAPGAVTVLVADDNDRFRSGMVRALGRLADVVVVGDVADGERALAVARELRPRIVLADARMPVVDGLEVARGVTADPALRGTLVVLLSARNDRRLRDDARAAGAVGCLDKSDSRREICDAVLALARPTGPTP